MDTGQNQHILIQASDLTIGYPGRVICGPISLEIGAGAGLGVIGVNGSGKSTLVQTILGALPSLGGTVAYKGRELNENSLEFRQNVAVQASDGAFFEELTVAEHLEMTARGHGLASWKSKVGRELEFFDLQDQAQNLPSELSSGQRRKLLLAATLIRPAQILILDEPEQRLDVKIRQRLYDRLGEYRRDSVAILAVTHDPMMLRSCLDEAFLMDSDQGQLMAAAHGAQWLER
ncbi:ABC transporter ATP-binding protein [Glutamicibacter uratoxydans]|uniref:ABC transporter ATP-binding protein n=1 Tax=Glutamicibacter uratoxydans TaxID=43667 RepID=A0A4Y4DLU7_GLUUR|nr:ABC transporter ATP-binding protein [Glutamicibacter uratoxydans]GED06302.1 ABC transporter ATP-binding protein [Glutamicibacter uratoxydans]